MENNELIISDFKDALTVERKPDLLFIHQFKGFGINKSECKVEIWKLQDKALVLFTDTGKGTSVTNASEQLVTEIYNQYLIKDYKPNQCLFSETYDRIQIDIVLPNWQGNKCHRVGWKHLGKIIK
jgi:hypothetical protein